MREQGRKKSTIFILVAMMLMVTLVASACSSAGAKASDVVARVNGEAITKEQLYDLMVQNGCRKARNKIFLPGTYRAVF